MKNVFIPVLADTELNPALLVPIIIGGSILLGIVIWRTISFILGLKKKKTVKFDNNEWFDALGNKDNIKEVSAVGSRLNVVLEDIEIINRDKLKELGVSNILVMSKKVTLVIEGKAEQVAEAIKNSL